MKTGSAAASEVRILSAWLIYSYALLLVIFAVPVGLLIYSIKAQSAGAGTVGIIVGISIGLFYLSAGRLVLRDLRHRRNRALKRLAS